MDLFFVPTPKSMARAVLSTVAQATTALLKSNADFRNVMQAIPIFTVSPVPMTWHPDILLFMGDDPTCPNCEPKPFVQSSIAYDILCSVTRCCYTSPLIALLDLRSTSKSAEVDPICSQCPTLATSCDTVPRATTEALQLFQQLSPKSWNQELRQAQRNVMALNVMTMQYAMPLLSPPVGCLGENIRGRSLGGSSTTQRTPEAGSDFRRRRLFDTLRLMSDKYRPIVNQAQALEAPRSSSQYLWVV
ncbi:hypothetical protein DYB37_012187 [Aphanomyces astaci]|uniref:Uncharacterized protein n=1 Tax=Aphanomyces astaci TaxID=112090 RepID=A0A418FI57_APHAT|nr:hypothetical protein DYB37_012187 [Aphanomyces astaci]